MQTLASGVVWLWGSHMGHPTFSRLRTPRAQRPLGLFRAPPENLLNSSLVQNVFDIKGHQGWHLDRRPCPPGQERRSRARAGAPIKAPPLTPDIEHIMYGGLRHTGGHACGLAGALAGYHFRWKKTYKLQKFILKSIF